MRQGILIFSTAFYLLLNQVNDFPPLENLALTLFVYFLLDFLNSLGKRIVIMDLSLILASLTCLLLPVIFYHEYTRENKLARIWFKYMFISSEDYFSFAVPGIIAMAIGFRLPLGKLKFNKYPAIYIDNVKKTLEHKPSLGLTLIGVGLCSGFLDFLSPASLKQVFYLLDHLTYVGVFYVIYSPNKYKRIVVPSVIALMFAQSLITGMFGELVNMLACSVVLILLGKKISFQRKLMIALAGIFFVVLIQSVKVDYRKKVWYESAGADPIYYAQLVGEKLSDPSTLLDPNKMFFMGVRLNQGWLVAYTMASVPKKFDFGYGETIWQAVAAAIVPRFIWPDKPEAGGKANLKRFLGYNISGFSMNIGPLGEAYANFDVAGGVVYLFFYGLFFNLMLTWVLRIAEKRPTIVLWIPFLFFYAIGVETDLLSTMGALIKGLMFTWIVFKIFHAWFKIEL